MLRAGLKFFRRLLCATILLALIVCGAEVVVRTYEVVQGKSVCSPSNSVGAVDPTGLSIPSWTVHHELKPLSAAKVPGLDLGSHVDIRTNSTGLRGPEVTIPKPDNVYRIILLGDETIFSPEIPESEHCIRLLHDLLQTQSHLAVEIINAGLPGACPLTEYLLFKQRLLALQPDLVLVHYDWSDVADDQQMRRRAQCSKEGTPLCCPHPSLIGARRLTQPIDKLRQQFRLIDWGLWATSQEWKRTLAELSANTRDSNDNHYAWLRDEQLEGNIIVQQSFRPISDLAQLIPNNHFQLAVITSPKPWQVSARCSSGKGTRLGHGVSKNAYFPSRAPFVSLANYVIGRRLQYADASLTLTSGEDPDSNFIQSAPRWSPAGHRRVAEFLASFLMERVPGPWNRPSFEYSKPEVSRVSPASTPVQWASGQRANR